MSTTNEIAKLETDAYIKTMKAEGRPQTIAVVGRGGAGKSSTINSIVGSFVAPVSHTPAEGTLTVREYRAEHNGFNFRIFDTPGFGTTRVSADSILDELARLVGKDIHILLYVLPLTQTRLDEVDSSAIQLLHNAFGKEVWERIVIVFTHADEYGERYTKRVGIWTQSLYEEIVDVAGVTSADLVGFVAISNGHPTNPDGKKWMGELFTLVVERIRFPLSYIMSQLRRLHKDEKRPVSEDTSTKTDSNSATWSAPSIDLDKNQRERVFRKTMIAIGTTTATVGIAVGVGLTAPFIAAGAAVGLLLGLILGDDV